MSAYYFGMLRELAVQNLAVIEDVRVELQPGFCAWTGETGAGKSLLLGAIGLLLGERGSAELIRAGQDELRVTGRFELARVEQRNAAEELLQTSLTDDELIVTRRLARTGRSSALVNEQPVSVGTLRKLGAMLVDVHGQHESYSLLQPAYQLDLLDAFGKLAELRATYNQHANRVRELRQKRQQLSEARQARRRELTLLRFERDELQAANLQPDELAGIQREREKLLHAQSLAAFSGSVATRLQDEDGSVNEVLRRLLKEAGKWSHLDKKLGEVVARLDAIRPELQDIADTCRDLAESYEANPERLDAIEHRLQQLKTLEVKYSKSLVDLIDYRESLDKRESDLQQQEDDLEAMDGELATEFAQLADAAKALSKARAKVAKKLATETQKHLGELQMGRAKLEAILEPVPLGTGPEDDVPVAGIDHLELMLTANPGEPARPLRKVASGGELSRTMLALKTVLAAHDPVRTLVVFDEIDSNVGGRLGDVLGQKLASLGGTHQILCVTHLPQVASYAIHQWTIRKQLFGKRTTTTIAPLASRSERVEELAIMLRGEARSETTRKEADEMLASAQGEARVSK